MITMKNIHLARNQPDYTFSFFSWGGGMGTEGGVKPQPVRTV